LRAKTTAKQLPQETVKEMMRSGSTGNESTHLTYIGKRKLINENISIYQPEPYANHVIARCKNTFMCECPHQIS
jgi:hypothetical protein